MSRAEPKSATLDVIMPALLNRHQLARLLGDLSVSSIERLDASGRLGPRPVRLGRLVRWSRQELEDWIAAGCPVRHVWEKQRGQ